MSTTIWSIATVPDTLYRTPWMDNGIRPEPDRGTPSAYPTGINASWVERRVR